MSLFKSEKRSVLTLCSLCLYIISSVYFQIPIPIPQNYTASDLEPEQRVAYFREDIGVNLHHWHWHLVYPFDSANRAIVDKDRRGELFYYMHQQLIAR